MLLSTISGVYIEVCMLRSNSRWRIYSVLCYEVTISGVYKYPMLRSKNQWRIYSALCYEVTISGVYTDCPMLRGDTQWRFL
jgi:hypothetical protein